MNAKNWIKLYILVICVLLTIIGTLTIIIDPYFHYHKPLNNIYYSMEGDNERYYTDGIIKQFKYDAVITGTSMTENFKASEFNNLFVCHSIKVPLSGATYYEINREQEKAFLYQDIKYMVRSLDTGEDFLNREINALRYESYPNYLYNNNLLDDVKYIWNINVIQKVLSDLRKTITYGGGITSFDEYANWMRSSHFGTETVLNGRTNYTPPQQQYSVKKEDEKRIKQNIQTNVLDLVIKHPETTFYYFIPPYSIGWYGDEWEKGTLQKRLQEEELAIRYILDANIDNLKLFSFVLVKEWILNLDNYRDKTHYNEQINSSILQSMKNDYFRLTKDNIDDYIEREQKFFLKYDYNSIIK